MAGLLVAWAGGIALFSAIYDIPVTDMWHGLTGGGIPGLDKLVQQKRAARGPKPAGVTKTVSPAVAASTVVHGIVKFFEPGLP